MSRLTCLFLMLLFLLSAKAQELPEEETELVLLFEKLRYQGNDSKKDSLNALILNKFRAVLEEEESFDYPFSQLRSVGILQSEDGLLKIYNWNIFYSDASNSYYGFVQYRSRKNRPHELFELTDKSENIENPLQQELSPDNWYGCLYYDLVEKRMGRETIYTLMGWDANTLYSNKKIIDVIHTDKQGITFGLPVFNYQNKIYHRYIFEYAQQANMLLHYDKRYDMIIWDHLSPSNPTLKGRYQYYGPDGTQDGFNFEDNQWEYYPDIVPKNRP